MTTPNRRRSRRLGTRQRVVRATLWTVLIILLLTAWSFAAACDMPGSCT